MAVVVVDDKPPKEEQCAPEAEVQWTTQHHTSIRMYVVLKQPNKDEIKREKGKTIKLKDRKRTRVTVLIQILPSLKPFVRPRSHLCRPGSDTSKPHCW